MKEVITDTEKEQRKEVKRQCTIKINHKTVFVCSLHVWSGFSPQPKTLTRGVLSELIRPKSLFIIMLGKFNLEMSF